MKKKEYLGDSVYVEINEFNQIILTIENGEGATNTIYLEPEVYATLTEYVG